MPLYDYECRDCGHITEVLHGVNEAGPTACPSCGGPMRKMLSTPAIVFKGSGWAKKDARDASKAARSGGGKADDAKPGDAKPGDATGGDAKPADAKDGDAKTAEAKPGPTPQKETSPTATSD